MQALLGGYRRLNDALATAISAFAALLVAIMVATPFIAAVLRNATGQGYDWLAELPPQLVPWIVFPLAGVMLRRERHIAIDLLPHMLAGSRAGTVLRIFVMAVSLCACLVFAVFGVTAVSFFAALGQLSTTEIEFPLWILYVSYPVGFFLAANFCFEALLQQLTGNARPSARADELPEFVR